MAVRSLAYVVIEATDLEQWRRFATDILGLMPSLSDRDDLLLFRMDDRPYRLWIEKGERNALVAPGWELASKADFDATLARLRAAGRPVEIADAMEARARRVYELARSSDPAGNPMELSYGRFADYVPFSSPAGVSRFVTGENGDMGLGHVVLTAPNFEETHAFYKDVLGFGDTDLGRFYLGGGGADDPGVGFAFLHCNGRHHSLALGELPESPNGAVHMMLETGELADVGRAYDKALKSKGAIPVSATLGQHVNDKMTSFYLQSPGGFDIEYGWNGLVIDPARWIPTTSMTVSAWGHKWAHEQD
jgi:3,4-dihydroxy-9,10-secoandrosta-1,3,5(10)-triene-9,17-dione 4,5-dioxygenase